MFIKDLFDKKKVVFSYEVFPPKKTSPMDSILSTLEEISALSPDFMSVTYGAGGSVAENRTCELSSILKTKYNVEPLSHLTCINSKKDEIIQMLHRLKENNIHNILALRGDLTIGCEPVGDFSHATDLIEFIKSYGDFDICAACYPEGHIECDDIKQDIRYLKAKVTAGANHLISQLFFDNEDFYRFLDLCDVAGIDVPIQAGIMPVINKKQIERMVSLCGVKLPRKFSKIMARYEHSPEAMRDAGIAYASGQIIDLIASGVQGIHLYTMNNPFVAAKITENIKSIIESANGKEDVKKI